MWILNKGSVAPSCGLRDALGDSTDNPIFIQTIERRGYRWIGPYSAKPSNRLFRIEPRHRRRRNRRSGILRRYEIGLTTHDRKRGSQVRLWLAAVVFAVPGLAAFLLWRWRRPAPISSIAVLPFDNLSAPSFNDAFSDGLTDEIAASTSHLDGVRAAGRRSASTPRRRIPAPVNSTRGGRTTSGE